MTKPIPPIEKYMTVSPYTIGKEQTLAHADSLMREHRIRHLPVLEGGRLIGLISQRDIQLVETSRDVDPAKVTVEEAMMPDPYTTEPKAHLDEVVQHMAAHKYGSAVIMQNNKIVGIFTTIDALSALSELLRTRLASLIGKHRCF